MEVCKSLWEEGLKSEYYKGFLKNVYDLLAKHSTETVITYGTRRSRKIGATNEASLVEEKENRKSMVSHLNIDLSIYC